MSAPARRGGGRSALGGMHAVAKEMKRATAAVQPGAIITVRHGRPALDRNVRISWRDYIDWWAAYDRSGLDAGQTPPEALRTAVSNAHVIFSSTLPRALETALAVAPADRIVTDTVFVEAPLPPPPIPGKLRPGLWGVFARVTWWFGLSRDLETRRSVEQRAEAAAATLVARALRGETVILFAHGWFNRMLRPELSRHGFRCVDDGGDAYWSMRRFERRV